MIRSILEYYVSLFMTCLIFGSVLIDMHVLKPRCFFWVRILLYKSNPIPVSEINIMSR